MTNLEKIKKNKYKHNKYKQKVKNKKFTTFTRTRQSNSNGKA